MPLHERLRAGTYVISGTMLQPVYYDEMLAIYDLARFARLTAYLRANSAPSHVIGGSIFVFRTPASPVVLLCGGRRAI